MSGVLTIAPSRQPCWKQSNQRRVLLAAGLPGVLSFRNRTTSDHPKKIHRLPEILITRVIKDVRFQFLLGCRKPSRNLSLISSFFYFSFSFFFLFFSVSVKVLPVTPLLSDVFVHRAFYAYFLRIERVVVFFAKFFSGGHSRTINLTGNGVESHVT